MAAHQWVVPLLGLLLTSADAFNVPSAARLNSIGSHSCQRSNRCSSLRRRAQQRHASTVALGTQADENGIGALNRALDVPKLADTALAGSGLAISVASLGMLEQTLGMDLFAVPMMASGIIFFAGATPPAPNGFISGTVCSATLGWLTHLLAVSLGAPEVTALGASAGVLLVWYKAAGAIFPPAAVVAGTLTTTAFSATSGDTLDLVTAAASWLVCPWIVGHGALYAAALLMSKLRVHVRAELTKGRLRLLEDLDDAALRTTFDKFDTDGSGGLDAEELRIALRVSLGSDVSLEDCERLVMAADADGNGVVDYEEFVAICRDEL